MPGIPSSSGRGAAVAPRCSRGEMQDLAAVSPRCPSRGVTVPRSPLIPIPAAMSGGSPGQCRAPATSAGLLPPVLPHAGPWGQPRPHLRRDPPASPPARLGPAGLPSPARVYCLASNQPELLRQEPFPWDPSGLRDTVTPSGCPCHHPSGEAGGPGLDPRVGTGRIWAAPGLDWAHWGAPVPPRAPGV